MDYEITCTQCDRSLSIAQDFKGDRYVFSNKEDQAEFYFSHLDHGLVFRQVEPCHSQIVVTKGRLNAEPRTY